MRIGLVGAGAMGAALGRGWVAGGHEVITCLAGRSERTRRLAAGLTEVESLAEVSRADVVVSVVPPGAAVEVARGIAAAARQAGTTPLVADLNAVSPPTVREVELALDGLPLLDGSISGGPPTTTRSTRAYVCGPHELPTNPWVEIVRLDGPVGTASALKMCTASMYKGTTALAMQAMITAEHHGVLDEFFDDIARQWPGDVPGWPRAVAVAVSKSARFVDEMHEIARTQAGAGLPAALFEGVAAAYARAGATPPARRSPEDATEAGLLAQLAPVPRAVLFDFSGTLFRNEDAAHALLGALGPQSIAMAAELTRRGAINGSTHPEDLPDHLADVWERRDLDADAHRAAYSGIAEDAGLSPEQAAALYERGVSPEAWTPYPDTVRTLRALREQGVPVAIVSNIGWDLRPVLDRYGVDVDALVLSMVRGVLKPDPEIFRQACAELAVEPANAVMIGDNPHADGGSEQAGVRFRYVDADPAKRLPGALGRASSAASE